MDSRHCKRAFVRYLDGTCSSPVAAFGIVEGEELFLRGLYYREKDGRYFKDSIRGPKDRSGPPGYVSGRTNEA